ncbi:hypothetical protein HGM15179_014272 [Zosterops borbonicus]|uniref:Integrase-type domain-containing protein n=1 Tax=Zosterops borbonicus TaxID=364589 RepID=A0A8K1G6I5_9PASS|nr:hypothetical protein HGM15179_014272 [Zosterops borbonicus]
MIKQASIRNWDRRNPQRSPGDQKWPSTSPDWSAQTENGRKSMIDLKNIIIQGEVLLKTQFVAKSWEDIQRKLEKIDGWQDKSLQELLKKPQKVYIRREDKKQKVQAKVLVAAVKEVQRQEQASTDINPKVWHSKREGRKLEIDPIHIAIENPEDPIRVKQYPIPLERRKRLKQVIDDLLKGGTLEPCMSPHNTPILAVRKADGSYKLVQDLRAVNARTKTRFPVVANPYTLLNRLTPEDVWYSVIDLKDAFWTCPLDEKSRDYFAFQWEDPDTNKKQQHFASSKLLSCKEKPPVLICDPEYGKILGPYPLITWGRGFACISSESGPRWIPAKNVKPFREPLPAADTSADTSDSTEEETEEEPCPDCS